MIVRLGFKKSKINYTTTVYVHHQASDVPMESLASDQEEICAVRHDTVRLRVEVDPTNWLIGYFQFTSIYGAIVCDTIAGSATRYCTSEQYLCEFTRIMLHDPQDRLVTECSVTE